MGKIQTCQTALIALLAADSFFTDNTDPMNPIVKVALVNKQRGAIESQIDEALANVGGGVVVLLRQASLVDPEDIFGLGLKCQFALSAFYNPVTADVDAPTAFDMVERCAIVLQGQFNGVGAGDRTLSSRFSVDSSAIKPLPPKPQAASLDIQLLLVNTTIDLSAA